MVKKIPHIESILDYITNTNPSGLSTPFLPAFSSFLIELLEIDMVIVSKITKGDLTKATTEIIQTPKGPLKNITYLLNGTPCEKVANKELCYFPKNLQSLFPDDEFLVKHKITTYIGIPLFDLNREPIGMVAFLNKKPFNKNLQIESILKLVSIKIGKILEENLLEEKKQELKASEKKAFENELKFKTLTESSADGIAVTSLEGDYLFVNQAFCDMVEYSEQELLTMKIFELFPKNLPNVNQIHCKNSPESLPIQVIFETKSGNIITTEILRKRITLNNQQVNLCSIRNITAKLLVEKSLQIEKENYQNLFNENPVSLWEQDFTEVIHLLDAIKNSGITNFDEYINNNPDFVFKCIGLIKVLHVNTASAVLFKAKNEEHLIKNFQQIFTPETRIHLKKYLISLYNEKTEIVDETQFINLAGEAIYAIVKINTYKNKDTNRIKSIVSIYNITKRTHILKELQKSEDKYRNIVENTSEWIWELNTKGQFTYSNAVAEQITGYSLKEIVGKSTFSFLHKTHRKNLIESFKEYVKQQKGWRNLEIKFLNKLGEIKYLESNAVPIINEKGNIIGFRGVNSDISERKRSEQVNKKLSLVVDQSANSIVITDIDGNIEYVNQKFIDVSGYTREEAIGQNPRILNSGAQPKSFYENLWNTILAGKVWKGEFLNKYKNGKTYWEDATITPIKNDQGKIINFLAVKQHISSLKEAELTLQKQNAELHQLSDKLSASNSLLLESKNRYVTIFENSPVSLLEVDYSEVKNYLSTIKTDSIKSYLQENPNFVQACIEKTKIIRSNKRALKISNNNLNSIEIFKALNYNTLIDILCALYNNKPEFVQETDYKTSKNKLLYIIFRIVFTENPKQAIVAITNITKLKYAKEQLQDQNEQLLYTIEKAKESDKLKTEFLNNLSHEIRTPMNGILGFSEVLATTKVTPEKQKNYITIIQKSAHQLLKTIDDIIEISKLGTKQIAVNNKPVCLNDLVTELFSIFNFKSNEKNIPLYLDKKLSDDESTILTDEAKLHKILSNLLENSFKFTNHGSINLGYYLSEGNINIFVKDTGIGIHKEKQSNIMDRFTQEEKELSQKFGGLGLGLSIAKENTELLGGKLLLESEKFVGSIFTVSLPYNPVNPDLKTNKNNNAMKKEEIKPLILIVEDEEVNYLFLETLIHDVLELNCNTLHAKNGKEAVDICTKQQEISLVLMDIKMPIMNGYDATKEIKKHNPNQLIVAQTAYSTDEDKEKAYAAGCTDFLSKPITRGSLQPIISKYLNISC